MAGADATVIVVSRHRAGHLVLCLKALALQDHPAFEIVVVADPEGSAAARALCGERIKLVTFDEANIARARNLGLAQAAAPVVAFLDDDAIAEPTWLSRLTAPFADARVVAAGGFVRGWTGLRMAFSGGRIDRLAVEHALDIAGRGSPALIEPHGDSAVVTIGTNCAFRAEVLRQAGGFDPAYAYFLDESDVNMRLAATGGLTAIVPDAEVMHLPAASVRRTAGRMPLSLHDIGVSTAVFLRRHAPGREAEGLSLLREAQRRRLLRFMVQGRIAPGDVPRLRASLEDGIAEGMTRTLGPLPPLRAAEASFLRFPSRPDRPGRVLAGWVWDRRALRGDAARAAVDGAVVTILVFSPGFAEGRASFHPGGWWEHEAGLLSRPPGAMRGSRPLRRRTRQEAEISWLRFRRQVV